jgi:hypothetical protein
MAITDRARSFSLLLLMAQPVIASGTLLDDVNPEHVVALELLIREHKPVDSGDPILIAQAIADLNGDGLLDGVVAFAYQIGPSRDRRHTEYLTIVSSSSLGFTASWPIIVGARGFRTVTDIKIDGTEITLLGDFSVSDETASMATLLASGEVYYSYENGELREQGGRWSRKSEE